MSSIELENKDVRSSRYYINEKGHRIHQDPIGQDWFMKPATGGYDMGFENIFYSQILDQNLKTAVLNKIEKATGKMESLQHDGKWYNIFINNDEIEKSNVNTKSTKKYDEVTETPIEVKDVPKEQGSKQQGQKRDRPIVIARKWIKITLEESIQEREYEKWWREAKDAHPNNYIVQEGNEKFMYEKIEKITFNY